MPDCQVQQRRHVVTACRSMVDTSRERFTKDERRRIYSTRVASPVFFTARHNRGDRPELPSCESVQGAVQSATSTFSRVTVTYGQGRHA